jgi:hypothetical protein
LSLLFYFFFFLNSIESSDKTPTQLEKKRFDFYTKIPQRKVHKFT